MFTWMFVQHLLEGFGVRYLDILPTSGDGAAASTCNKMLAFFWHFFMYRRELYKPLCMQGLLCVR